jgi:hypothetical protein
MDKGVALSAEGLSKYARMVSGQSPFSEAVYTSSGIDPEEGGSGQAPQGDGGSGGGEAQGGGDTGGEAKNGGTGGSAGDKDGKEKPPINGETLRSLAVEAEAKSSLLELLNRVPGKDGKRWLAIPLSLTENGVRFHVTLRVLLSAYAGMPGGVEQMALDINGGSRRWFFVYKPDGPVFRAAVWPLPGKRERAKLERELAEGLGLPPEQVRLSGGDPVLAADCRSDSLFSVREEV